MHGAWPALLCFHFSGKHVRSRPRILKVGAVSVAVCPTDGIQAPLSGHTTPVPDELDGGVVCANVDCSLSVVQVVAYNTVIDLLGKMGRWEEALQMYQRMRREVSLCATFETTLLGNAMRCPLLCWLTSTS